MPITINGSGSIGGINAGGLPDGVITTDDLASNAVTTPKLGTNEQSGLCKAWVNFNGTGTVAIRASYNVSSITDNGTGDYTVNFATALADTNYSANFGGYNTGAGDGFRLAAGNASGSYPAGVNTGSLRIVTFNTSGAYQDQQAVCVAIFR
jgi:hypothetical protein